MSEELTVKSAVEFAVKIEKAGAGFYRRLARKFSEDKEISSVFAALGEDEDDHEKQFQALLDTIGENEERPNQRERLAFVKAMSLSEFFVGEKGLYSKLDQIKTREDALERAFQFEKNTVGYYQAIKDVLGDSKTLGILIDTEKGHVLKLMDYMITGAKVRGL